MQHRLNAGHSFVLTLTGGSCAICQNGFLNHRLVSVHRDFSEQVAKLVAVDAMRSDEPRNEDREFQELWVKSCGPQSSHGRDLRPKQRVAKTLQKGFSTSCFAEDRETLRGRALVSERRLFSVSCVILHPIPHPMLSPNSRLLFRSRDRPPFEYL